MLKSKQKLNSLEISDELTIEHNKDDSDNGLKSTVQTSSKSKKVRGSLIGIAAIAACGAVGYALTRPSNKRRLSRYSDQLSGFIPGLSPKTSRTERLANQILDLIDGTFKR